MANFDLGRVVPLYKGVFSVDTTYELNDVVTYNGSLYWHKRDEATTGTLPTDTATWVQVLSLDDAAAYIQRAEAAAEAAEDSAEAAENSAEAAAESAASIPPTQRMIAFREESNTASQNYSVDDLVIVNDVLYRVTAAIATGETITPGTNVTADSVETELKGIKSDVKDLQNAILLSSDVESHKQTQDIVRAGLASMFFKPGDMYKVDHIKDIEISFESSTITDVSITDKVAFLNYVKWYKNNVYRLVYDEDEWEWRVTASYEWYHSYPVLDTDELIDIGISIEGDPSANDVITVTAIGDPYYFEVLDTDDLDVPVDSSFTHTLPLLLRYPAYPPCGYGGKQYLKAICADEFPDGLPAGTYYFTLDHAAANGTTGQDDSYSFTTTQTIPVGGGISHGEIGQRRSSYNKTQIRNGKFSFYDADGQQIGMATTGSGSSGTYLGTTSAIASYIRGSHVNLSTRNGYGSSYILTSDLRQWIKAATPGSEARGTPAWWTKLSEFGQPVGKAYIPGFLFGVDPDFLSVICPVRKRTYIEPFDRTDDKNYVDTEESFWIPSRTEVGLGNTYGVAEGGVTGGGVVVNTAGYALYRNATSAERVKIDPQVGRGVSWWLRSCQDGDAQPNFLNGASVISLEGEYKPMECYYTSIYAAVGVCIG